MASSSSHQTSLPSINELFPEHMMHSLYCSPRDAIRSSSNNSAHSAQYPPSIEHSRKSVTPVPSRPVASAIQQTLVHHHERSQIQSSLQGTRHHRPERDARQAYRATDYSPQSGTRYATSDVHSCDQLRQNYATSSQGVIATSQTATYSPRSAHSVRRDNLTRGNSPAIHGSRSGFLPTPPSSRTSPNNVAAHPVHQRFDTDMDCVRGYQDSIGYRDNIHISPPTSPYHSQPIPRMNVLPPHSWDEKKHCCPHCNKRFNRPSSLSIHVNTHTGAKPFLCPYPSCQRRFNVNSNMRRHYRNHISSNRRRDAVARLVEPTATPPLSSSLIDTPASQFSGSLSSSASSDTSTTLPSRPSSMEPPSHSESDQDEDDDENREDWLLGTQRYASSSASSDFSGSSRTSYFDQYRQAEAGFGPSRTTRRQRSRSSPAPPSSVHGQGHIFGGGRLTRPVRPRSSSCNIPGCDCQPAPTVVSTTLRPAFTLSPVSPSSSKRAEPPS